MSPLIQFTHRSLTAKSILEERNHLYSLVRAKPINLRAEQRRALGELVTFASSNSTWWRNRLSVARDLLDRGASFDEVIEAIPVTTRRDLQDNFQKMVVRMPDAKQDEFRDVTTSGSTGKAVKVKKYLPDQLKISSAFALFEVMLHKRNPRLDTLSITTRTDEHEKKPFGKPLSVIGWSGKRAQLSATLHTVEELVDELEKGKYGYLFANANQIRLMAQEQLRKQRPIKLREIQSWVDLVDEDLRRLVRQAFKCRINDRYSSEEFGPIAIQCPKFDHLHLISPYFHMEVVDKEGEPVKQGEIGRVQLTNFTNRSFPLLRYQLGDLVVSGPPCKKVSWPTIEKIVGRVRDYIPGPDGELVLPRMPGLSITKTSLFLDRRIYLFEDKAVLLVAPSRKLTDEEVETFQKDLEFAFYLEPGQGVLVTSQEGNWRNIWKRKSFERIEGKFSEAKLLEVANFEKGAL